MDMVLATLWRWLPEITAAGALLCLAFCIRAGRRHLLVDNLPTSKTSGVFMGLVELKGTAETDTPLTSYLADVLCVYYRFTIRERSTKTETTRNSDGTTSSSDTTEWTTIASGGYDKEPFYLKDDRGVVRIRPDGATVEARTVLNRTCRRDDPLYEKGGGREVPRSDHVREFKEEAIQRHAALYVVGQARQRLDAVAAEIAQDAAAPMFLISTRSEQKVSGGLRLQFWSLGVAGTLLACLAVHFAGLVQHPDWEWNHFRHLAMLRGGLMFLALWLLGWIGMMYNSLVELRQRVSQGWANIDVELKRRADLLPNLEEIIIAVAAHERLVQPLLAALRTQGAPTAPGRPGPDPAALSNPLRAVGEAFPQLKANPLFLKLHKQLTDTEDRIALARNYFNDIATFYNTRIAIFPDGLIAGIAGLRPQALMRGDGFIRPPVTMKTGPLA